MKLIWILKIINIDQLLLWNVSFRKFCRYNREIEVASNVDFQYEQKRRFVNLGTYIICYFNAADVSFY